MKPVLKKLTSSPQSSITVYKNRGRAIINRWHYHPELELVCVSNCPGTWLVGDLMENSPQFNVLLLGPDLPHTFHPDPKCLQDDMQGAEAIVVQFCRDFPGPNFWNMPEMKEIGRILELSGQGLLISGETNRRVACLMSQMLNASPSGRVILLLTILDEIARSGEFSLLAKKSFNYSTNYKDDNKLSKVFEYTFQRFNKRSSSRMWRLLFRCRLSLFVAISS